MVIKMLNKSMKYEFFEDFRQRSQIPNTWKVLKCGAGEGWSVGPLL
jgi:hypothetical protein